MPQDYKSLWDIPVTMWDDEKLSRFGELMEDGKKIAIIINVASKKASHIS